MHFFFINFIIITVYTKYRARGARAFTLHPCGRSLPYVRVFFFVHSPKSLLHRPEGTLISSFSPTGSSRSVCSLCTASRLLLLLLTPTPFSLATSLGSPLLTSSLRGPLLPSLSLRLFYSVPPHREALCPSSLFFLSFLLAFLLASSWSSCSFYFQHEERDTESIWECARKREGKGIKERGREREGKLLSEGEDDGEDGEEAWKEEKRVWGEEREERHTWAERVPTRKMQDRIRTLKSGSTKLSRLLDHSYFETFLSSSFSFHSPFFPHFSARLFFFLPLLYRLTLTEKKEEKQKKRRKNWAAPKICFVVKRIALIR